MIYDNIEHLKRYPFLEKVKNFDFDLVKDGKFEIEDDVFFGVGLNYKTKPEIDCLWESHKKYLDVHVILEGEEIINVSEISQMEISKPYVADSDYMLFNGIKEQSIHLTKGSFLVLYPNEVHQTAVMIEHESAVKKVVFKLMLEAL